MNFLKVALVISLGLGVTWAADRIAPARGAGIVVAQADDADTAAEDAAVDEQLERIQKTLDGGNSDELKDFVPTEPLSADIAIEFPSDI